jgi:hypothetical protein
VAAEGSVEEEIVEVARALKRPAGDSELFSSPAAVLANHEAFVRACHDTWKEWHETAIHRLEFHEAFLQADKARPLGPGVRDFGNYNLAVWRRVNDAIVWSVFGAERHKVKRLCLYKKRNDLAECNPNSVIATLASLNSDPLSLAIWNDATSCVDIGDIMYIKNGMDPVPEFLELKEGPVNSEIIEVLKTEEASRDTAIKAFEERFGKKGMQQLERVLRQKKIGNQALALLANEKGIDPVTGFEIEVMESATPLQTYDAGLCVLLEKAAACEAGAIDCVDGCLWIFAAAGGKKRAPYAAQRFIELLETRVDGFTRRNGKPLAGWDRDKIRNLSVSVKYPLAKPLFLRNLDPMHIASLTYGRLLDNVLMYLDWGAFGRLIAKAGGEFRWGSRKEAGRARSMHPRMRPPLIRGRVPQVHVGGATRWITDPNLIELFYDGMTPWTLAQNAVHDLHVFVKKHGRAEQQA